MRRALLLAVALAAVGSPVTHAAPSHPSYPFEERLGSGGPPRFVQDQIDPHRWVWTIDPAVYAATGTITFFDYRNAVADVGTMRGPGNAGVNDWQVCNGRDVCGPGRAAFDHGRPSFTQDVRSVPADFLTPDARADLASDWDVGAFRPDAAPPGSGIEGANIDGAANLFRFGFTVAPGTRFENLQVDRSGNYFIARRDMQWEWIDELRYEGDGEVRSLDTQFNIQPYPISDGYGWCASVSEADPNALTPMAGQLIKDIAFDVWAGDSTPALSRPFTTEVVPSFAMRSYGRYEVDVTMLATGVRQRFSGAVKGTHIRPVTTTIDGVTYVAGSSVQPQDPDFQRWFNRVSPIAAGVVPIGAWVLNEGTPYLQVVPVGTPGAVWHQNRFAGAAYLVRGDMERSVNYTQAASAWAGDTGTVVEYRQVYKELEDLGEITRADWSDWAIGGRTLLPAS